MTVAYVLAPHPDDEVLGASHILRPGPATVVHVTDGVPPWLDGAEAPAFATRRQEECRAAWQALGADIDEVTSLGFVDLGVWRAVDRLADAIVEQLIGRAPLTVYVPAHQGGHPDHDATFAAALLARRRLGDRVDHRWRTYALYGYDADRRLTFGALDARDYRGASSVQLTANDLDRKAASLRCFTSQLRADSVVQQWLNEPAGETTAALPADIPTSELAVFYDEELDFARHGVTAVEVATTLRAALDRTRVTR